jgi:hypothetical protein
MLPEDGETSYSVVKSIELEVVESPHRPRGRPRTLSLRRFVAVCKLVEAGAAITAACEAQGISYAILRKRCSENPRLEQRMQQAEKVRFAHRHEEALSLILSAATRSWQAAAWYCERAMPERYALKAVPRDLDEDKQGLEEELPLEAVKRHRALLLELAKEDEERAKSAQSGSAG